MINDINALARARRARRGRGAASCRRLPDAHAGRAARRCSRTPRYDDVVAEVTRFPRRARARLRGAPASRASASCSIRALASARRWRTISRLLRALPRARRAGLSGARRAVAQVDARRDSPGAPVGERVAGSVAAALAAVARGAAIVRVHDVRETVDALKVWRAVQTRRSQTRRALNRRRGREHRHEHEILRHRRHPRPRRRAADHARASCCGSATRPGACSRAESRRARRHARPC